MVLYTTKILRGLLSGAASLLPDDLRYDRLSQFALCFVVGASSTLLQASLLEPQNLALTMVLVLVANLIYIRVRKAKRVATLGLMLIALLAGHLWASLTFINQLEHAFPAMAERSTIEVTGQVHNLPVLRQSDYKFQFLVSDSALPELVGRKLALSCYRCPIKIQAKQVWRFSVRLKRPSGYASWGAFDFEKYLFRQQVIARGYLRLKEPYQLLSAPSNSIQVWRAKLRQSIAKLKLSAEQGEAVILALALGDKSALSSKQREHMQTTGVSHLMAISGLHVGLVFVFARLLSGFLLMPFARLFLYCPRQWLVLPPALACAVLYSAMAGFAVSTQRAIIMLGIYTLCRLSLRQASLLKVLLCAAFIIVIVDPHSVMDAGFWLSCVAVLVIALLNDSSDTLSLLKLQPRLWLGMLPITAMIFGQVSLLSPIVNLVMVPLFCLVLIPVTLAAVVLLQLGLEGVAGYLLNYLSKTYAWLFELLASLSNLPISQIFTVQWSAWQYSGLLLVLMTWRAKLLLRLLSWCALIGLLFIAPNTRLAGEQLEIALLDVGQGLAMVVRDRERVLVYDTGPRYASGFSAAEAVLLPYLRLQGIRHVDRLIISHADNDHIGGLSSLRGAFSIGQTISSRPDRVSGAQLCQAGQRWQWSNTQFKILSPDSNTPEGSNNLSCVLQIVHGKTRILITGDIEKQVERYLVSQQADLPAEIILVPHQGSKTSSTERFLDAVKPRVGLVAAGYLNHYGHPHAQVSQRYQQRAVQIESTIDNGTTLLRLDLKSWSITRFRQQQGRFWHR